MNKVLDFLFGGIVTRILVFKLRREGNIDILVEGTAGGRIFWPISKNARTVVPKILANSPKKMGGYFVPDNEARETYDYIHHNHCPLIGSLTPFGLIIDTP